MVRGKQFKLRMCAFLVACSILPSALWAKNYYVDPREGSSSNNGSQAFPWKTLQEVFASNTTFQAGDVIYLLRGDHGAPIITGLNTGLVVIKPLDGHTPVVQSLRFVKASNWDVNGLFVSPKAAPNMVRVSVPQLVSISEDSTNNILENSYIFSDFLVDSWTQAKWKTTARYGVAIHGPYNIIRNNHIYNTITGLQQDFHAHHNLIEHNIVENFAHDGMQEKGSYNTFQYNLIMNAFDLGDGNHPDGFQAFGSGNMHDTTINGNIILSSFYHPNPALYNALLQGIGLFSSYVNYTVVNNIVMNDSRVGIWLLGGKNCKVVNNTVFPVNGGTSGIRLFYTFASGVSSRNAVKNIVENNIAGEFVLKNKDGTSVCLSTADCSHNLVNKSKSLFLNTAARDVHIVNNSKVVNAGDSVYAPLLDAGKVARNGRIDLGAYQFISGLKADKTAPSTPTGLSGVFAPGLGVDLSWTASTDNRKVEGYEIYRNGTRIGRIRVGTHFLDPILSANGISYTVKAFDFSMNFSPASLAVAPK